MRQLAIRLTVIAVVVMIVACSRKKDTPRSRTVPPAASRANSDEMKEWDDASLYAEVALWVLDRHADLGVEGLNDAELTIASLFLFHNEINNGGFGQWLYQTPCDLLAATRRSLDKVGARRMLEFVGPIFEESGGEILFNERTREAHLDSLSDSFHEALEQKRIPYVELEAEFLEHLYQYVRQNWKRVRGAQPSTAPGSE